MKQFPGLGGPQRSSSIESQSSLLILVEKLERGDINYGVWISYFPSYSGDRVPTCEECEAFSVCIYNHDLPPLKCFSKPGRHYR